MATKKVHQTTNLSKSQFELVEDYLCSKYEFRYNEISNEIESHKKEEPDFKPLNENNMYRELQYAHLR